MRENRTYGLEGGESKKPDFPTPVHLASLRDFNAHKLQTAIFRFNSLFSRRKKPSRRWASPLISRRDSRMNVESSNRRAASLSLNYDDDARIVLASV